MCVGWKEPNIAYIAGSQSWPPCCTVAALQPNYSWLCMPMQVLIWLRVLAKLKDCARIISSRPQRCSEFSWSKQDDQHKKCWSSWPRLELAPLLVCFICELNTTAQAPIKMSTPNPQAEDMQAISSKWWRKMPWWCCAKREDLAALGFVRENRFGQHQHPTLLLDSEGINDY